MALETKTLKRVFRYNSVDLPDPGPQYTIEQVRDFYAATYPEIVSAGVDGPEERDGALEYTFRRAVGTKGAIDVKLDSEEIRGVLAEAILRAIDEQKRDALMKAALEELLRKPTDRGYGANSPIEDAFVWAARSLATKTATAMLEESAEFNTALKSMIEEAAHRAITEKRETMIEKITEAILNGLAPKDRH